MAQRPTPSYVFSTAAETFAGWISSASGRELGIRWADAVTVVRQAVAGELRTGQIPLGKEESDWLNRQNSFAGGTPVFMMTAYVGECFRREFGGAWFGPSRQGHWAIDQIDNAWASSFQAQLLVLDTMSRKPSFDVVAFLDDVQRLVAATRAGMIIHDTHEAAEIFHEEFTHLADLEQDELDAWASQQSAKFRALWKERRGENLLFDASGIERLDGFVPGERYLQTLSRAMQYAMACFLGESARRLWRQRARRTSSWAWLEAHESLGLILHEPELSGDDAPLQPPPVPAPVAPVFLPLEEIAAIQRVPGGEAHSLLHAVEGLIKRAEALRTATTERNPVVDDDSETSGGTHDSRVGSNETDQLGGVDTGVSENDISPWRLSEDLTINGSVFQLRRRGMAASGGSGEGGLDLVVPCMADLSRGSMPLALVPVEGLTAASAEEMEAQLGEVADRVDAELGRNNLRASLYVFFSYNPAAKGDAVVVAQPPVLVGGRRRFTWFWWPASAQRPQGPLTPDMLRKIGLFDPVLVRVRQALHHLQVTGNATEARRLLEEAVDLNPENPTVLMAMCSLHLAIGNQITARGYVQQLLNYHPEHVEGLLLDARFLLDEGMTDRAEKRVNEVVALHPAHPEAYLVRARIRAGRGDNKEALRDVEHARDLDPGNEEAELLIQVLTEQLPT